MKAAFSFCAVLFFFINYCFGQTKNPDIIVKKDNTKIESIITEIDDTNIKYKRFGNPGGPQFTIKKEEVVTILYANGEVETFSPTTPKTSIGDSKVTTKPNSKPTLEKKNTVEAGSKQELFIQKYNDFNSEEILKDMRKYQKQYRKRMTFGTIFATGGVASMVVGFIQIAGAENQAASDIAQWGRSGGSLIGNGIYRNALAPTYEPYGYQIERLQAEWIKSKISDDFYRDQVNALRQQASVALVPVLAAEYKKEALQPTLIGVGICGIATAFYIAGGTSGWKYKHLKQQANAKGITISIKPEFQPFQRSYGFRMVGTF